VHFLSKLVKDRLKQLLLAGEVVIYRPLGCPGYISDPVHAGAVITLITKHLDSRIEDRFSLGAGIPFFYRRVFGFHFRPILEFYG
jgi:hypothetical protein